MMVLVITLNVKAGSKIQINQPFFFLKSFCLFLVTRQMVWIEICFHFFQLLI